jgi:hypothetical protein
VESKWKNYHIITFPVQSLSKTLEEAMDLSQDRLILELESVSDLERDTTNANSLSCSGTHDTKRIMKAKRQQEGCDGLHYSNALDVRWEKRAK